MEIEWHGEDLRREASLLTVGCALFTPRQPLRPTLLPPSLTAAAWRPWDGVFLHLAPLTPMRIPERPTEGPLGPNPSDPVDAPPVDPRVIRFSRLFGDRRLPEYKHHLWRMTNAPLWYVFVAKNDVKCFTRWVRPVLPVKNPRSITGNQKYIAAARNDGVIF